MARQRPGTQIVEFASLQLLQVWRAEQAREDGAVIRAVQDALLSAVVAAHADHSWDDLDWDVRESLLASVVEKDPDASLVDAAHAELAAELFTLRRATGRDATTRELLAAITDRLADLQVPLGVLIVATAEALFDAAEVAAGEAGDGGDGLGVGEVVDVEVDAELSLVAGEDEVQFVAGEGGVVVGEADAAVELGVAGEAAFDAGHADEDDADVLAVVPVSDVFQGGVHVGVVEDRPRV